jgi:hypothetical protein
MFARRRGGEAAKSAKMVQSHAREAVRNKNIVFGGNPYFMPVSANAAMHRRRRVADFALRPRAAPRLCLNAR